MQRRIIAAAAAITGALASVSAPEIVDVLVYAANPAGIGAAIAAANGGKHTVRIMEPLKMIGGMGAAGGVGLMNQGCGLAGLSGLGRKWAELNGAHYSPGPNPPLNTFPDLYVAAQSFWTLLNGTSSITTSLGCRLVSVSKDSPSGCLTSTDFLCDDDSTPVTIQASVFIDASYDGDMMVGAGGIDYANGREAASDFNESLAGVNYLDDPNESFDKQNLSVTATWPNGTLLPGISPDPLAPAGSEDDRLMAYSFFPCVTDDTNNSVPYPMPEGYDPDDFALLQGVIQGVMDNGMYPNGPDLHYFSEPATYDTNVGTKLLLCCGVGPVNCDEPDLNRGWANANYTTRLAMAARHRYYVLGSLYYMANDDRVPNYTRYAVGRWGLCKDEYVENGYWPPQLYVRISNRLRGEVILTQNNLANPRNKPTGVSMGCWEFDQHTMSRHAVVDPKNASRLIAMNEGYMRHELTAPYRSCDHPQAKCDHGDDNGNWYDVPFEVMLPKRGQASNLLVPVALSATSIAYSSTRIEGMYMDLGTAAGVAAALVLEGGTAGHQASPGACPAMALQDTNITAVQDILVNTYKQRIHGPANATLDGRQRE